MADPKYANLPGLAPDDEPDTFETDERPEADQDAEFEDESDSVEKLDVSATDAFNKFKDKSLDGKKADFSDRLRLGLKTGYCSRSGQWELAGEGQPETVVQKYHRLTLEVQQLDEEIAGLQASLKPGSDQLPEQRPAQQLGGEVGRLQRHLTDVRLDHVLGAPLVDALGDPHGALRSKLEQQLSELAAEDSSAAAGAADGATYELHVRPDKARAQKAAALGELEKRLERIERVVGATPEKMSRLCAETRQRSLLSAVAALSARVSLLEPASLDAAEARLQALHQRMNQLAERRRADIDADKMATISELHELMQKSAGIQGELPAVIERLTSLQSLHDNALNFSRALSQLEAAQQGSEAGLARAETQLGRLRADSADSLAALQAGVEALTARLDSAPKQ